MADDEAVGERLHGKAEKIAADRLDDVLHEFRPVGFNAFPFFGWAGAFVGDGFPAEAVFSDPGFYIGQVPSGRERDEEHSAPALEADAVYFCADMLPDGSFDGGIHVPPEAHDVRV